MEYQHNSPSRNKKKTFISIVLTILLFIIIFLLLRNRNTTGNIPSNPTTQNRDEYTQVDSSFKHVFKNSVEILNGLQIRGDIDADDSNINLGDGTIIASNILYSITAGEGITITEGQNPTISSISRVAVSSIENLTGAIDLVAGSNISLSTDGNRITISSTASSSTPTDTDTTYTAEGDIVLTDTVFSLNSILDTVTLINLPDSGDLTIGGIGLTDTGPSTTTSGASLIGVYTNEFSNIGTTTPGTDLQTVLQNIDTALGNAGTGDITAVGNITSGEAFTTSVHGGELYFVDEGFLGLDVGAGRIVFDDDAIDKILLLGGNVGIGTTIPLFPLDVNGIIQAQSGFRTNNETITDFTGIGITLSAGVLNLDILSEANTSGSTGSFSGLEFIGNELTILQGCADSQVLTWNDVSNIWECATVGGIGGVGDITAVTAGDGLSGGGTSGAVTLDINLATSAATGSTGSFSGLEVDSDGLRLLSACTLNQILAWNGIGWECATIIGIGGVGDITQVGNITSGEAFTAGTPGSNLFIADTGWIGLGSAAGQIYFDDETTDVISFLNANIGIGTTNPAYTLDVEGNIRATTEIYKGTIGLGSSASPTTSGAFVIGVNPEFTYSSSTNVQAVLNDLDAAINGVSSGGSGLWLDGGNYAFLNTTLATYVGNTDIGSTGKINGLFLADAAPIVYGTNNNFRTLFDGTNFILGDTSNTFLSVTDAGTNANFNFNRNQFYIRNDGNVGVGTTAPVSTLDVVGTAWLRGSTAPNTGLYVNSISNVGVGTTTPAYKVDVVGTVNAYDLIAHNLTLSKSSVSTLTSYNGFNGYTNFSGGIGTGGINKDSITNAQRLTSAGNLVNIGSIQGGEMLLTSGGTFAPNVDYTTGAANYAVAIGDINGDGKSDIVVANISSNSLSVLMNNGNGTFAAKVDYSTGSSPRGVNIGDLNGDGKADIAVANNSSATVSVFINSGIGTFATKIDYTVGSNPLTVTIGDVNADGKADMLAANNNSSTFSVLMNNGNGTFATKVDYGGTGNPTALAIGDVNGDGKADVIVTSNGNIRVYINNGNGTFGGGVNYTTVGTNPSSVLVGDLNGDGKADIATGNNTADTMSVFINNGNGTFAAKVDYPAGSGPRGIAISDINGDGKADLAVANSTGSSVSVFMNNGNGTFAVKADYTTGKTTQGVALGDLNDDGKTDMVVSNITGIAVSVFMNITNPIFYAKASTGSVGIGTTALTLGMKLDVAGNIRAGTELFMGNIGLNDTGTSETTSGASQIGTFYEFSSNVSVGSSTVQDVLDDLDAAISLLASTTSPSFWTDAGVFLYPTDNEYLGNTAIGGSNKLAGMYLGETSPIYFGSDNDYQLAFNGTDFALGDGISNFLTVGDSGTTGNFAFNIDDFYIRGDGNVGVGTTNTKATLNIQAKTGSLDPEGYDQSDSITINSIGTGYLAGDILTLTGGIGGRIKIIDVTGVEEGGSDGEILRWRVIDPGYRYLTGTNIATTGGSGTGATFDINTLFNEPTVQFLGAGNPDEVNGRFESILIRPDTVNSDFGIGINISSGLGNIQSGNLKIGTPTIYDPAAGSISYISESALTFSEGSLVNTQFASSPSIDLHVGAIIGSDIETDYPSGAYGGTLALYGGGVGDNWNGTSFLQKTISSNITLMGSGYDGANWFGGDLLLRAGYGTDLNGIVKILDPTTQLTAGLVASSLTDNRIYNFPDTSGTFVLGTGEGNFIPIWIDANTISTSILYQTTGNIGIGTTLPEYTLDVAGTIRSENELFIGDIGLNDTGIDNTTSGASLIGVNHEFSTNVAVGSTTVQDVLDDLDAAIFNLASSTSPSSWTDAGAFLYPTTGEFLGNNSASGINKLTGIFLGDSAPIVFGADNDFRTAFDGTHLLIGDSSNAFLSIGDSGTTANFNFNNNQMYIRGDGNVGIGTTAPAYKLDVAGVLRSWDIITQNISLSSLSTNLINAFGGFDGYTNFSGGIGTGGNGKDSITNAQRLTSSGNLTNIGSYQGGEMLLTKGGTFAAKVDYTTGTSPWSVSIGDLNGDGKADLAVANANSTSVSVLINNGAGTFAAKVDYTTELLPYSVSIGDLNGDGKADLAVANSGSTSVSVFINNGDGTFATKVDYTTGTDPRSVSIGDLNGDGKADLAVSNFGSNSVSVFINNGNGTFAAKVDYTTASGPISISIGDLNGDGKADLAVVNINSTSISVFVNNGNGTFAAKVDYTTASSPRSVSIGDLNGDGKADLAVDNAGSNSVSVFVNNGNGTFATKVDYTTASNPTSVSIGDLNGDGRADLAVANFNSNSVSVLINNGDGTFATKVDYIGTDPWSVSIGDLNGDGKADLAVANRDATSVSVLMNQPTTMLYAQASTGNIGIGTTNPVSKLDIDTGSNTSGLRLRGLSETTQIADLYIGDGGQLILSTTANTAGFGAIIVDPNDDQYGFLIEDSSTPSTAFANFYMNAQPATDYINILLNAVTSTSAGLFIDDDDQIGIGTSNPNSALQVIGGGVFGSIAFQGAGFTAPTNGLLIEGKVSIGTTTPAAGIMLDIGGSLQMDIGTTVGGFALCHQTNGAALNQTIYDCSATPIADYMEMYATENDVEMGDLVSPSSNYVTTTAGERIAKLQKSSQRYQKDIIGIASDPNGAGDFNSIGYNIKKSDRPYPVGLNGRLKVKITAENGTIEIGDYITSSSQSGKGMKATKAGMVIGQALEGWNPEMKTDKVMVFVKNMYYDPNASLIGNDFDINTGPDGYELENITTGNIITQLAAFDTGYFANLNAGIINADDINLSGVNLLSSISGINKQLLTVENDMLFLAEISDWQSTIENSVQNQETRIALLEKSVKDIITLNDRIQPVATEEADITLLTERVSFLEKMMFGKQATESAFLSEPQQDILGVSSKVLDNLTVTGKTNLFDLGVVGDMSIGQIVVRGNEATINSLALPLQIQKEATAPIELMAAKVTIDTKGNLTVKEIVKAKKFEIDLVNKASASAGTTIIKAGDDKTIVHTTAITSESLIFTTPKKISVAISTQLTGKDTFEVILEKPLKTDLEVNWWLIN